MPVGFEDEEGWWEHLRRDQLTSFRGIAPTRWSTVESGSPCSHRNQRRNGLPMSLLCREKKDQRLWDTCFGDEPTFDFWRRTSRWTQWLILKNSPDFAFSISICASIAVIWLVWWVEKSSCCFAYPSYVARSRCSISVDAYVSKIVSRTRDFSLELERNRNTFAQ